MFNIEFAIDQFGLRLSIIALVWLVVWFLYRIANSNFSGQQKLIFKFVCLSYGITYFLGANIIFAFGENALRAYFHILVFPTSNFHNMTLLFLATIPFFVVALLSFTSISANKKQNKISLDGEYFRVKNSELNNDKYVLISIFLTIFFVFLLTVSFLGSKIPSIVGNSFTLGNISGSSNLYLARSEAFDTINFVQGGVLYGTLPALVAGLIQYNGSNRIIVRLMAAISGVLVVFLNLGLFQIGPLFAFIFVLGITQILRSPAKGIRLRYLVLVGALFLGYSFYSTLKVSGGLTSAGDSLLQIVMRMPVAGPYLVDMKELYSRSITASDYVPRLLGYHMFPEFWSRDADISMPQPSFLVTWYYYGVLVSFGALLIALALPFWLLKLLMSSNRRITDFEGTILVYSLCHYVYYLFQTSHFETLISSYGIIFPLIPYLIFVIFNRLLRPGRSLNGR